MKVFFGVEIEKVNGKEFGLEFGKVIFGVFFGWWIGGVFVDVCIFVLISDEEVGNFGRGFVGVVYLFVG